MNLTELSVSSLLPKVIFKRDRALDSGSSGGCKLYESRGSASTFILTTDATLPRHIFSGIPGVLCGKAIAVRGPVFGNGF